MRRDGFTRRLALRLRCVRLTGGLHELDLATSRCRYCKREWNTLYRTKRADAPAPRPSESRTLIGAAILLLRRAITVKR